MVIFPNHAVLREGRNLVLEIAEADLVRCLRIRLGPIAIASFREDGNNTSTPGRLNCEEVSLFKLNAFSHEGSVLRKLINYVWVVLVTPFPLLRCRFAYIFCPGHCGAIASLWAIILRRPYGLYVRGTWLSPDGRTSWLWKQVFRNAAFIIATGEAFRRRLGAFNDFVENEVPLTKIVSPGSRNVIARRLPVIRKLLFAGRLTESKGILDLIMAVAIGCREFSLDIALLIAGGGTPDEEEQAKRIAQECEVSERISFLGHVADVEVMRQYYHLADAFIFPSYYREGFPRVLYEAMMCALPIVTTEMPGTEGFLVDSKNCLICKPRDPHDIVQCITRLSRNPKLALAIGTQACNDVLEVFNGFKHPSHADQLISLTELTHRL